MSETDATHDPALRSWVESANDPATDFPIQNLPFGVFRQRGGDDPPRVGLAIGDLVLDPVAAAEAGFVSDEAAGPVGLCGAPNLNALMAAGREASRRIRWWASRLLESGAGSAVRSAANRILVPMKDAELLMPVGIGDYSDFYASIDHATNVGRMFRPDNPLLPNYKYVPIGYHGRASSIVVSGTVVRRPRGQIRGDPAAPPAFDESRRLDYEVEIGAFVGAGNALGEPIPIDHADDHIFGLCLLNDWSARDIQSWEYQPLGPFLSKSFATTISPWVTTVDALAPFRSPARTRAVEDPAPLPYLESAIDRRRGAFDVTVEAWLTTSRMRNDGVAPFAISRGNLGTMYWTFAQLLAHHASNGCNLRPGDLLGSGTISGPDAGSQGCLLERTSGGEQPLELASGERRTFLADGDEVTLRAYCERDGARRIGFGECVGRVAAAAPGG